MKVKYFNHSPDKNIVFSVFLIMLGLIILFTDYVDSFVTQLLWPLLEGSSEGKTVLFLWMLGSTFIFSSIIQKNNKLRKVLYKDDDTHLLYTKITVVLLFICAFIGLFIEANIRHHFGVSFYTILTSMAPDTSTTSPMHSHIYKSVLGILANYFVPSHVNTAYSILQFGLPYALIIVVFWPICYVLGLIGVCDMPTLHRFVASVSLVIALIGLLDGGLFSQPFLIGTGFLLLAYYSKDRIGIRYLVKPVVIMGYILLLAMIIEVGGSDTSVHTLTVVNQTEPVDMTEFNVSSVEVNGDLTVYTLSCDTPDKDLIQEVFAKFKGKSDLTFMSWNFYSYLDNPTMRLRQNKTV